MKKTLFTLAVLLGAVTLSNAQVYQSGYTKSNGTYVEGHYKSTRNSTNTDNYSTQGNTNPYSGSTGYKARDYSQDAYNYGSGKNVQTGSRGGQYYINSNNNKTYVPKRSTTTYPY
ncbi:hypothetical protein SAMN06265337_2111 [Hymenobacter gelipurpurascens]|uniref:PBCV-specific basic adaptor domain-containing protein n=1 Tax=Hymenobacter gelipurpurascens TaxID=89968 RepID=A0A212TPI9_9BACT|nr:hypothetical protein [Hymenobacter gelipurpurascens]SNC67903.1 hypothetical protein SAMN06265337_2111 [Hymenobacter gelipurpurascens]